MLIEHLTPLTYWGSYAIAVILTTFTMLYTVFGGLTSVIYTDVVQSLVLILGSVLLLWRGFSRVLHIASMNSPATSPFWNNEKIVSHTPQFFHLFNDPGTSSIPWTGAVGAYFVLGVRYWCCDQVIVQRALGIRFISLSHTFGHRHPTPSPSPSPSRLTAAKNVSEGRLGCVVAGFMKLLPFFIMVIPGV